MAQPNTSLLIAQFLGISTSLIGAAATTSFTFFATPFLTNLSTDESQTKQSMAILKIIFTYIEPIIPPLNIIGTGSLTYLAYATRHGPQHQYQLNVVAAGLVGAFFPLTILFWNQMGLGKISKFLKEGDGADLKEYGGVKGIRRVHERFSWWSNVRASVWMVGGLVALYAGMTRGKSG